MTRLSDTQLILLATAAQRSDGSLLPPPDTLGAAGGRIAKAVTALVKRGFAAEADVPDAAAAYRSEGERPIGVVITDAGRTVIAANEPAAEEPPAVEPLPPEPNVAPEPATAAPLAATKIGTVLALLQRDRGATLDELTSVTGWLPHTTRAALTGLRKKGHAIDRVQRDDVSCYIIAGVL